MKALADRGHWLFARGTAVVYLIAFASFYPQIPGLVGENGLQPFAEFFQKVHQHYGARSYYLLPGLAWIHPTGGFLQLLAALGMVVALLAAAGIASGPAFLALWVLFLS